MAEGFVSLCQWQGDEEDVAKSYFNELVNRSLIQPERSDCGEVLSCRVHDMMLDLILKRCTEDNFMSVAYSSGDLTREHKYNIRRLSLHFNAETSASDDGIVLGPISPNTSLSKVRSLSVIGSRMSRLPLFPFHKYLRMLDLQMHLTQYRRNDELMFSWWNGKQVDLTIICQLLQLRYLKLDSCSWYIKIPSKISRLGHLETLEILGNSNMPSQIVDLPRLSRLVVHWGEMMPYGLGKMKSLRTLAGFDLLRLDTKALGELTNLRDMRLCCGWQGMRNLQVKERRLCCGTSGVDVSAAKGVDSFYSSIGKLRALRYLEVRPGRVVLIDDDDCLGSLSDPPPGIEILKLKGFLFSRIPRWIRVGALNRLRRLELLVSRTSTDEVDVLGELPSLMHFGLELESGPPAVEAIVFSTGFLSLESLSFYFFDANATSHMGFQFQEGVMPRLQRLTL
jgi:hypothetical protein